MPRIRDLVRTNAYSFRHAFACHLPRGGRHGLCGQRAPCTHYLGRGRPPGRPVSRHSANLAPCAPPYSVILSEPRKASRRISQNAISVLGGVYAPPSPEGEGVVCATTARRVRIFFTAPLCKGSSREAGEGLFASPIWCKQRAPCIPITARGDKRFTQILALGMKMM